MSELVKGVPAPLFDRLASDLPAGSGGHLETMEAVQASIGQELRRLLNTRSSLGLSGYASLGDGSVLEYGVPDFSSLSAQSADDMTHLQSALRIAIERYEPRLANVTVELTPAPRRSDLAFVRIGAEAKVGIELRRVDFEMLLGAPDSLMKVV